MNFDFAVRPQLRRNLVYQTDSSSDSSIELDEDALAEGLDDEELGMLEENNRLAREELLQEELFLIAEHEHEHEHEPIVVPEAVPEQAVNDVQNRLCPICKDFLFTADTAATVPCGHTFHEECLSTAMACRPKCALCNQPVTEVIKLFMS